MPDDTIHLPDCPEEKPECPCEEKPDMATENSCDSGNQCVALTGMANGMSNVNQMLGMGFAASADRRTSRADQISGDTQAMWSIAMTTPTQNAAMAYRTATESGSGAARYAPYVPPTGQAATL